MEEIKLKHCIQSLFYNIAQTARICRTAMENYFDEHAGGQVSFSEFIILDTVYCFPEICQRDLARLILKGTSHTSKLLTVMEKKGLIKRPVDTKGNRIVKKIIITGKGMQVYEFASKLAIEFSNSIEDIIENKYALDCISSLNKIKETVQKTSGVKFE